MSWVRGLQCKECKREYPKSAIYVCEYCFGPLEVMYDYAAIMGRMTRCAIESRPRNLWRYRELLPIDGEPQVGLYSGYTPLIRAENLARELGVQELWIKNDGVNAPTLSYKDRVDFGIIGDREQIDDAWQFLEGAAHALTELEAIHPRT